MIAQTGSGTVTASMMSTTSSSGSAAARVSATSSTRGSIQARERTVNARLTILR
ncbi:unannotated protein [freshwater metagenome]|uniref:Unannotated protein n=1 Tax=freshwater metagenome TaxID=449393 RepID=A0A6J7HWU6_9ZZZZ